MQTTTPEREAGRAKMAEDCANLGESELRECARFERDYREVSRVRLPFPIGRADKTWVQVQITRRHDGLHAERSPFEHELWLEDGYPADGVDVVVGESHMCPDFGIREFYEEAKISFTGEPDGTGGGYLDNDVGTVMFPSFGAAVAHVLLTRYGADYLCLPQPVATIWKALQTGWWARRRRDLLCHHTWKQVPQEDRERIVAGDEEADIANALAAHALLDGETHRLVGRGFDELLNIGRPYSPEEHRYLDAPYEYSDGSLPYGCG